MLARLRWPLAAVAAVGVGVLSWWWFAGGSPSNYSSPPPIGSTDPVLYIVDHEAAIYGDGASLAAVDRHGGQLWRQPADDYDPAFVACGVTCRSAVLSSSLASLRSAAVVDARPRLMGTPDLPAGWSSETSGKNAILATSGTSGVRLATASDGSPVWEVARPGGEAAFRPAAGTNLSWFGTNTGTAAIATVYDPQTGLDVAQGFRRVDGVWRFAGPPIPSKSSGACISADGRHRIVDGRRILGAGRPIPLDVPGSFSNCGFFAEGAALLAYRQSNGVSETTITTVDERGEVQWTRTFPASEVIVSTDVLSDRMVLTWERHGLVLDQDGTVLKRLQDVAAAAWDDHGELCVLTPAGEVSWMKVSADGTHR